MKILIIYEMIPEETKFYSVEVTADEWAWMRMTHGNFINCGDMDEATSNACNQLSIWLDSHKPSKHVEPIIMRGERYDYVLHTGFVM